MLATSHRQRAKIRRNGDHRSPRRLKKKGSYSEKTYQKEPKHSGQQLDLRLLRKDPMKPKDQGNLLDISLLGRSLHCPTIWWCAEKIYPGKRFDKYAILGDDICIADSKVAEVYLSTLKDLGFLVNLTTLSRLQSYG
ncbi:unnamed protein product [Vicia faba]|uniref:Uncharacterized protein n=1 Tax=Vicia faba TaxID=3906 RepID=A0AAV1AHD7_VICFA|nr:unnamed protein product [Vicia faba]